MFLFLACYRATKAAIKVIYPKGLEVLTDGLCNYAGAFRHLTFPRALKIHIFDTSGTVTRGLVIPRGEQLD
jgi:hypothetical protein